LEEALTASKALWHHATGRAGTPLAAMPVRVAGPMEASHARKLIEGDHQGEGHPRAEPSRRSGG